MLTAEQIKTVKSVLNLYSKNDLENKIISFLNNRSFQEMIDFLYFMKSNEVLLTE